MEDSQGKKDSEELAISGVKLEHVKNNSGTGTVMRMRAADGKFVATTKHAARRDAVQTQKFLMEVDPNTGKSRNDSLIEALYKQSLLADSKSLGSAVKFMEAIDNKAGFTKVKNEVLSDHSHIQSVVKVVINSPVLMHPEIYDGDNPVPAKTQPSFAATEPAQPAVIYPEYIMTNARGPKKPTGRKPYEEFSPEATPVPAPKQGKG
jgi:hypothetical protein